MTTTHEAVIRPSALPNAPAAIFAALGLIDLAMAGVIGSADAPPLVVSLSAGVLGLITLVSLMPARRGSRLAMGTICPFVGPATDKQGA
jgi:hypothetical protein